MPELQERLDKTERELRELAAEIIEQETWAAQRERTGLKAQQALMGFVETIRKIGKGTGKAGATASSTRETTSQRPRGAQCRYGSCR